MASECRRAGVEVALLIDFPGLVRGVESGVDCDALYRFAGEHGRVAAANAYADWTADGMSRYRATLGGFGVEAVQVPGRSDPEREVCMRMAIDAVDLVWTAPQVGVYVIVAADGGLFPALNALRRGGRKVIGMWPAGRWS
ncbi:MAG: NYN domain-containing protein [Acidobacteria bacterium]|nr:NYN domain-containing protein [Acidobacteriota bacterium]